MKKMIFTILCLCGLVSLQAQVGINISTPDASAALDIVSSDKGILIPRMTTAQKLAIGNPAEGLIVYDATLKCIAQNAGTSASPTWVCLSARDPQNSFFYMPTISIDASKAVTGIKVNLYEAYRNQFIGPIKNPSAPANIPYFIYATDLYYYITNYDANILANISIDNEGVMTYDVKTESDYDSFMTVVFVLK